MSFFKISSAQKTYQILLTHEIIQIADREFYFDSVIDNRINKSTIGVVQRGVFNANRQATLENGLTKSLIAYFGSSLPKETEQTPITIMINKLEISEKTNFSNEYGFVDISVEYFFKDIHLYHDEQHIEYSGFDVTALHESNIREALKKSINAFNNSNWTAKLERTDGSDVPTEVISYEPLVISDQNPKNSVKFDNTLDNSNKKQNRNITAIGYQLGGYSLIGIEYEIRVHNYFGLNFGAGFSGLTAGIKIHTNPKKNSPFFNLNFKDGGFGLIEVAALEFGGRLVLSRKSDFGIHYQLGFAKILEIDETFERKLYNNKTAPPIMLSMGIGFSW
jgi:hypothetical protein